MKYQQKKLKEVVKNWKNWKDSFWKGQSKVVVEVAQRVRGAFP